MPRPTLKDFWTNLLDTAPGSTQLTFQDPEDTLAVGLIAAAKGIASKAKGAVKKMAKKARKKALKRAAKGEETHRIRDTVQTVTGGQDLVTFAQQFLPGGAPMKGGAPGVPGAAPPGVHGHWTKGTRSHPSHWSPRRRPRMHVTNPKALRRALRRAEGFGRLARRYVQLHTRHHFKHHSRKKGIAA